MKKPNLFLQVVIWLLRPAILHVILEVEQAAVIRAEKREHAWFTRFRLRHQAQTHP